MTDVRQKKFHDHVGHMIFIDGFAYCKACEMHWIRGEYGWIPDDDDRAYRGAAPKRHYAKGKKNWKRK